MQRRRRVRQRTEQPPGGMPEVETAPLSPARRFADNSYTSKKTNPEVSCV